MAQPTTTTPGAPPQMAATHGITPGAHAAAATPPEPVLLPDLEPVHFVRLYPEAVKKGGGAAAEAALAAGKAVQEAGAKLEASQQQVPNYAGEAPPPKAG